MREEEAEERTIEQLSIYFDLICEVTDSGRDLFRITVKFKWRRMSVSIDSWIELKHKMTVIYPKLKNFAYHAKRLITA